LQFEGLIFLSEVGSGFSLGINISANAMSWAGIAMKAISLTSQGISLGQNIREHKRNEMTQQVGVIQKQTVKETIYLDFDGGDVLEEYALRENEFDKDPFLFVQKIGGSLTFRNEAGKTLEDEYGGLTFNAVTGPLGNGATPDGTYSAKFEDNDQFKYDDKSKDEEGKRGFKIRLFPDDIGITRTGILIHCGNVTAGCIGISGARQQIRFKRNYKRLSKIYNIKVRVKGACGQRFQTVDDNNKYKLKDPHYDKLYPKRKK